MDRQDIQEGGKRVRARESGNALQPSPGTSLHPLPKGEGRKSGNRNGERDQDQDLNGGQECPPSVMRFARVNFTSVPIVWNLSGAVPCGASWRSGIRG